MKKKVILSPPKEEKLSTLNSGFSVESKVCDKCGSVLQQTITTGLRTHKVEPVNSSMSEPKCTTCGKGKNENVFCSNSFHLCEPVVSQDQEERFDLEKLQSEYELSIADPGFETFNQWMNRRFKIIRNP